MIPPRILVVDDNPTNLKLVVDLLTFENYEVLQALDAEQAREVIQRSPPELILMDIALPGMDGLTFTRNLKADEKTRSIVVVALTAFAMKGDEEKAIAAGCAGYITKPIDTRRLPDQVAAFLPTAQKSHAAADVKILIVEDHPAQLKLAHHVLSGNGNHVSNAEDAIQAFASIRENKPDVILLDLALPDLDGLALARKLKADPQTHDIPIVAVTSYPERFPKAAALAAGCDAYLLKPINTRDLPEQLKAVIGEKPLGDAS